jgi:GH15 family glucan-1,4-alpha-glucosidase
VALRIEEYAIIGDTESAALVGVNGSIDWLCPAIRLARDFAALLGTDANGHWQVAPAGEMRRVERRYRPGTLVLETVFETDGGAVRLVDCMPPADGQADVVRVVEGVRGRVAMEMRLVPRFDYGRLVPALGRIDQGVFAVAGPDAVCLRTPVSLRDGQATASAAFTVSPGECVPFYLVWYPSHVPGPEPVDPLDLVARTEAWWQEWSGRCQYRGPYRDDVLRSLITLKALTYSPTGAIVAAATTSLPEEIGGERNWDYRYCWLRDGAFTLAPLVRTGYLDEALAWRAWLLRPSPAIRVSSSSGCPPAPTPGRAGCPPLRQEAEPLRLGGGQLDGLGLGVVDAHLLEQLVGHLGR